MNVWYLDSSALVKHHVAEVGSLWINAAIFEPLDNLLQTIRTCIRSPQLFRIAFTNPGPL